MAGDGQVQILPKNTAALNLLNRQKGLTDAERLENFRLTRLPKWRDSLYTFMPFLGTGVRARQRVENVLWNFREGLKSMNEADADLDEARGNLEAKPAAARRLATRASVAYDKAMFHFGKAGQNSEIGTCVTRKDEADNMAQQPEKPEAQQVSARPGGPKSGDQVKKDGKPRGGVKPFDWEAAQKAKGTDTSHFGGLPGQG